MSPSSQSSVALGSVLETVAELTKMVEVIGGSGPPNGIRGGISAGTVVEEATAGGSELEDDVVVGSDVTVAAGSKTSGVAVTTIVLVAELSTTSIVATIMPAEGEAVVVTVAVETSFVVLVTVSRSVSIVDELALPSTLTMLYAARPKFCCRTSSGRDVESRAMAAANRMKLVALYRILISNSKMSRTSS
jgi:hypothetical protein